METYWKLLKPTPGNGFVYSLLTWHPLVIVPVLLGVAEFPSSIAQMRAHWKLVFGAVHLSTAVVRSSAANSAASLRRSPSSVSASALAPTERHGCMTEPCRTLATVHEC